MRYMAETRSKLDFVPRDDPPSELMPEPDRLKVQTANAPASVPHDGHTVYFCSDHCRIRFEADPARYARTAPSVPAGVHDLRAAAPGGPGPSMPEAGAVDPHGTAVHVDPVCGMTVDPDHAGAHLVHDGADVWFCCQGCADAFAADPGAFRAGAAR